VIGLWERCAAAQPLPRNAQAEATVMDSATQRFSAVGSGAALELRGRDAAVRRARALTDVTITVRPGERRAVLGSNGAGKTRYSIA